MARYQVFQVDAFTRTRFEGNPAGVVLAADGLSDREMQTIARELNNSETAFVLSPRDSGHDVVVRFFTPLVEVPVCGHTTVAAHYVRAVEGRLSGSIFRQATGAGIQRIEVEEEDGDYRVWIDRQPPVFGPILSPLERAVLLAALGIEPNDMSEGPVEIVSTGHSKVMVPIRDRTTLDALAPNLAALAALSRSIGCNGYHLFARSGAEPGITAHARMFAPAIGIAEDPVTGNANGPLGAYLVRHGMVGDGCLHGGLSARMRQGEAIGRPGDVIVEVSVDPETGWPAAVRIAGDAVIVFRTEIEL